MALSGIASSIKNSSLYQNTAKAMRAAGQRTLDILPDSTYSNPKVINDIKKIGEEISSAEQRLILGASALISQPFIDARNKKVDEKTRKVSVARTIAKILVGTFTGYFVRKGCIKAIKTLSQIPGPGVPKYKSLFTPKDVLDNTTEKFKQYRNTIGTVTALVVMMFTNFLIDAPLTKLLTNAIVKRQEEKK